MTPEQEQQWREEFLAEFHDNSFEWKVYLSACKKRSEEIELHLSNFRFVNKKSIELNKLLADAEKEITQLKEELKRERESHEQDILWLKSGNVQLDDLVADIERKQAQRKVL